MTKTAIECLQASLKKNNIHNKSTNVRVIRFLENVTEINVLFFCTVRSNVAFVSNIYASLWF